MLDRSAEVLYKYMDARIASAEKRPITRAVPGFPLEETQVRATKRALQNIRQSQDPTSRQVAKALVAGFGRMLQRGANREEAMKMLLLHELVKDIFLCQICFMLIHVVTVKFRATLRS